MPTVSWRWFWSSRNVFFGVFSHIIQFSSLMDKSGHRALKRRRWTSLGKHLTSRHQPWQKHECPVAVYQTLLKWNCCTRICETAASKIPFGWRTTSVVVGRKYCIKGHWLTNIIIKSLSYPICMFRPKTFIYIQLLTSLTAWLYRQFWIKQVYDSNGILRLFNVNQLFHFFLFRSFYFYLSVFFWLQTSMFCLCAVIIMCQLQSRAELGL